MLKRILAGLIVAMTMANGAVAAPVEDADAAYQSGDYATAFRLSKLLAEQGGDIFSKINLAHLYENGQGTPQDYGEALKWYRLAAEQEGLPGSPLLKGEFWNGLALHIGVMYANGEGAPLDYVLAYMWWNLGAAGGDKQAATNRDAIAAKMTSDQIAQAQRLAREWKPTPAQ